MAWTFFDYVTDSGRNAIRDWVEAQPHSVSRKLKAALNARLLELELVTGPFDRAHGVGQLRHDCKGLFEIIVVVARTQFRIIGCYGPQPRGEFTMLLGATEKGNRFSNPETCRTARERMGRIENRKFIVEHSYD